MPRAREAPRPGPLRCRACGYGLADVPARRVDVRCPECGGLTPRDDDVGVEPAPAFETVAAASLGPLACGAALLLGAAGSGGLPGLAALAIVSTLLGSGCLLIKPIPRSGVWKLGALAALLSLGLGVCVFVAGAKGAPGAAAQAAVAVFALGLLIGMPVLLALVAWAR